MVEEVANRRSAIAMNGFGHSHIFYATIRGMNRKDAFGMVDQCPIGHPP